MSFELALRDDGWTRISASPDTRKVYVSSSIGSDLNDGLSPDAPKASIAAARALIRDQYPDWLLLKSGDVWSEPFGNWATRGRSGSEPQVISSYGEGERPLISMGGNNGLDAMSSVPCDFLAVVNIHFRGREGAPLSNPHGIRLLTAGSDVLIEGCLIEDCFNGVTIQRYESPRPFTNLRFRRNIVTHNYAVDGGHSQGAYFSGVSGLLIEENIFDHNGWSETVPEATPPTMFRHNMYIQSSCTNVTVKGNFTLNAAATGVSQRYGGAVTDNIMARNPIAVHIWGGESILVAGNVILDGRDIDDLQRRGWGVDASQCPDIEISDNLMLNNASGHSPAGISVSSAPAPAAPNRTVLKNNTIYNWKSGISINGDGAEHAEIRIVGNHVQDTLGASELLHFRSGSQLDRLEESGFNMLFMGGAGPSPVFVDSRPMPFTDWRLRVSDLTSSVEQMTYPDPARSIAGYHGSLGRAASYEAFVEQLHMQSKSNWRPEYTAGSLSRWLRDGFSRP